MAKGKHATALFEVMNKTKFAGGGRNGSSGSGGGGGGGLPTPKWWFKSNSGGASSAAAVEAPQTAPAAVAETTDYVEEAPVRQPAVVIPPLASSSIELPSPGPAAAATPPRAQPVAVSVDPDRQLINLRMSYTSALIGGFGIFIALGLAVLIGKGFTRGPSPAIASTSTQQLKQRPATPGVLNVQRRTDLSTGSNDTFEGAGTSRTAGNTVSTGTRNPQQSFNDPRPPATFFTDDAHRQNGLNYAIIQSYPDKETADKAAEFLTKSGIPCTVEQNLPNWKLPWPNGCVVVGIRGFAKVTNNPALDAYKKSIMDVSNKFTNGRSRFAGFAVSMYLWKKSN